MKKLILTKTVLIASFSACLFATVSCSTDEDPTAVVQEQQTNSLEKSDALKPYTYVEQMPAFKGGEDALMSFLGKNIRYPEAAQKAGIEGLTVMSFVVETDGTITNIQTVKSLSPETDQEAARVVKLTSGNWNSGTQGGKPVRVQYTLPVRYAIK